MPRAWSCFTSTALRSCTSLSVCLQADQRSTERLFGQQYLSALWELPQHHLVWPSGCPVPRVPVLVLDTWLRKR